MRGSWAWGWVSRCCWGWGSWDGNSGLGGLAGKGDDGTEEDRCEMHFGVCEVDVGEAVR